MNNKQTTNKEEMVYKDTVYAKMRRALYYAVESQTIMQDTQWDENGRCHMIQSYGNRGIIATMQKKKNNKGWVVFFSLSMLRENSKIPFVRNLKIRLTVNETPDGVRLLWFVDGKPQWHLEVRQMVTSRRFHYAGEILEQVLKQIMFMYSPEDFVPILKYMEKPAYDKFSIYGLRQNQIKRLSGGTNPKQILNKIYGKDGQNGLSKNAFGGLSYMRSFTAFAISAEIVRYLKSFPSSFFDKIIMQVQGFEGESIADIGLSYQDAINIQYFLKYFNHNKIQQEFVDEINSFETGRYPANQFFKDDLWHITADAGIMLKNIKNRTVRQNIFAFRGTVHETHDLITLEYAKLDQEDREIRYAERHLELDNQQVTDNIISVLPKTTFDLILWGLQQHNCIGSYGDRVLRRNTVIVGFKDKTTGNWIGHAELGSYFGSDQNHWNIRQLSGKYNAMLHESEDTVITAFLNKRINAWNKLLGSWQKLP